MTQPCPAHPSETAFEKCRKCGRPACAYCLDEGPGDVCDDCHAKDEARGQIALERRELGWPTRILRTFRQVLGETGETFGELGPGNVGPAIAWAAGCWALSSAVAFLVVSPFIVMMSGGFSTSLPIGHVSPAAFAVSCCSAPLIQAFVGVSAAFGAAAVFHLGASMVGGEGRFSEALRATGYAQAIVVVWGPLALTMLLPQLGLIVVSLGFLGQLAWGAALLTNTARAGYGLRGGRAVFAGALPALVAVALLATILSFAILANEAASPDLSPDRYGAISRWALDPIG